MTKKHTGLIELYTSGDISKEEFTELRRKYSTEIDIIKSKLNGMEVQQNMKSQHSELIADIKNPLMSLLMAYSMRTNFMGIFLIK